MRHSLARAAFAKPASNSTADPEVQRILGRREPGGGRGNKHKDIAFARRDGGADPRVGGTANPPRRPPRGGARLAVVDPEQRISSSLRSAIYAV